MFLAYALPFFCDATLYLGVLGCLGLLHGCGERLYWIPVLLTAACWLSGRLTGRGKPWLRWLPMAAEAVCLVLMIVTPGGLAALPMMAYLPLYVYNNRRAADYDYAADRFRHSLIAAGIGMLLGLLFHATHWKDGLPWLFLYFTLNMALLRLLRHDDRVARSVRFRLINLGGVAMVCALGFGLSQPGIVSVIRAGWRWFLDNVILNLLALMLYLIRAVLFVGAWLVSLFGHSDEGFDFAMLKPQEGGQEFALPRMAEEVRALPPFVRLLLQGVGIALLAALVFVILRALSRRVARSDVPSGTEERESLEDDAAPRPRLLRLNRHSEDGVRQQYRRALLLIRARGGRVAPTMNTLQIGQENASAVDAGALEELRRLYLPVRYGGRAATREDVRQAKAVYDRLKKS